MINKIKFYLYAGSALVGTAVMIALVLYTIFRVLPEGKKTIGVKAIDGYAEETEAAMDVWNGFVGCKFLVAGDDVLVMSDDGDPCGDPWRPEDEWNKAATAYDCGGKSEILISKPGNTNTQACIIAHELGHVIGRKHAPIGVMSDNCSTEEQNYLRIRDADVAALKKEFCQ